MQNSWFNRFFERVAQLVKMNFVILIVSLCGLAVFGIYPALFGASAYFNEEMEGRDPQKFPFLFAQFKRFFWKANLLMVLTVLTVVGGFFMVFGTELGMLPYLLIMTLLITVFVLNMYLACVCILYPEFSFGKQLLFSLVAASTKWKSTLLLTVAFGVVVYAVLLLPQFGIFVAFALLPWINMLVIKRALRPETIFHPEDEEEKKPEDKRTMFEVFGKRYNRKKKEKK